MNIQTKPLEWMGDEAQTPFGKYRVYRTDDGYGVSFEYDELVHVGFNSVGAFESPRDTAISYAQPHYHQRILFSLDSGTGGQQPVAWISNLSLSLLQRDCSGTVWPNEAGDFKTPLYSSPTEPKAGVVSEDAIEACAVGLFRFDYPQDKWERFGQKDYHPEKYRAKARAALTAVAALGDKP